jgi:hypothetical protein
MIPQLGAFGKDFKRPVGIFSTPPGKSNPDDRGVSEI